jgi:hypothetical protein
MMARYYESSEMGNLEYVGMCVYRIAGVESSTSPSIIKTELS